MAYHQIFKSTDTVEGDGGLDVKPQLAGPVVPAVPAEPGMPGVPASEDPEEPAEPAEPEEPEEPEEAEVDQNDGIGTEHLHLVHWTGDRAGQCVPYTIRRLHRWLISALGAPDAIVPHFYGSLRALLTQRLETIMSTHPTIDRPNLIGDALDLVAKVQTEQEYMNLLCTDPTARQLRRDLRHDTVQTLADTTDVNAPVGAFVFRNSLAWQHVQSPVALIVTTVTHQRPAELVRLRLVHISGLGVIHAGPPAEYAPRLVQHLIVPFLDQYKPFALDWLVTWKVAGKLHNTLAPAHIEPEPGLMRQPTRYVPVIKM